MDMEISRNIVHAPSGFRTEKLYALCRFQVLIPCTDHGVSKSLVARQGGKGDSLRAFVIACHRIAVIGLQPRGAPMAVRGENKVPRRLAIIRLESNPGERLSNE
jgi:hypothetical protein